MGRTYSSELPKTIGSQSDVNEWAQRLIWKWLAKLDTLGLHGSGMLMRSFRFMAEWESRAVSGDNEVEFLHRVQFVFLSWGKMLDYGIGRGTTIQDRFELGSDPADNPRKRKRWITEAFAEERAIIKKLVAASTSRYALAFLRAGFDDTSTVFQTKDN